ncbi:MAG: DUF2793 domain-containing protein [Gammaproteobacteria bacterium]|nr:DUF2793 domain-containing protein [Gammaproteobacteria bacterium]
MAMQTGPNMGVHYNWDLGSYFKDDMDYNLKLIDAINQLGVISLSETAQPGSPSEGDRYILPAAGLTGSDWPGNEDTVAVFIGGVWEFHTPKAGWQAFDLGTGLPSWRNGDVWVSASTSGTIVDLALTGATPMDISLGRNFRTNGATGDVTLSFTNIPTGVRTEVAYTWVENAVGGHNLILPVGCLWPGGVVATPTSTSNARDEYLFIFDDAGVITANVVGQGYA